MKIRFKRENENLKEREEFLVKELNNLEEYMSSLAPGGDGEYEAFRDAWLTYYKELQAIEERKNKKRDLLPWLTLLVSAGGVLAGVFTSLHKDKTKKELGEMIYQEEEVDNHLGNGSIKSLSFKD